MKITDDTAVTMADRWMNLVDRATVKLVKVGGLVLVGVALGYAWRMVQGG